MNPQPPTTITAAATMTPRPTKVPCPARMAKSPAGSLLWSGKEVLLPAPAPLRTARAPFDASSSSMKQRAVKHAVTLLGRESHLHGTRTEPAPEVHRWWQPHQQGPLRPR